MQTNDNGNLVISTRQEGAGTTLVVSGCLDTAAAPAFATAVEAAAPASKTLTFDFAGLEFIASAALRQLVSTYKRLKSEGGDVILANMSDVVREVFSMTGLDAVFTVAGAPDAPAGH